MEPNFNQTTYDSLSSDGIVAEVMIKAVEILLFFLGTFIQWKTVSVCQKEKFMTWRTDIAHSVVMMIFFSFAISFEIIMAQVPSLYQYTGTWTCYIAALIYVYSTYSIGFHSLVVAFMKYVFIVKQQKVLRIGEAKVKRMFYLINILHPLLLAIPTVLALDFETSTSLIGCFGLKEQAIEVYGKTNVNIKRMFLCRLNSGKDSDATLFYFIKQSFCALKTIWVVVLCSNILEAFLYNKIFRKMKR